MDVDRLALALVEVRVVADGADEVGDPRWPPSSSSSVTTRAPAVAARCRRPGPRPSSPTVAATRSTHSGPSRASVSAAASPAAPATPRARSASASASSRSLSASGSRCSSSATADACAPRATSAASPSAGVPRPASSANATVRASSASRSVAGTRAAAATGLLSSCASPAASWPTASSFSRSRSMPFTAWLTDSKAGRKRRSKRRVGERQPAQLLAVDLEEDRVDDRERRAAVARLGQQRHRAEESARAVAHASAPARRRPRGSSRAGPRGRRGTASRARPGGRGTRRPRCGARARQRRSARGPPRRGPRAPRRRGDGRRSSPAGSPSADHSRSFRAHRPGARPAGRSALRLRASGLNRRALAAQGAPEGGALDLLLDAGGDRLGGPPGTFAISPVGGRRGPGASRRSGARCRRAGSRARRRAVPARR